MTLPPLIVQKLPGIKKMKISIKDRFDIFLFGTGYKQDFREEKKSKQYVDLDKCHVIYA